MWKKSYQKFFITGLFVVLFLLFGFTVRAEAATLYTNSSTGNDTTGDGSSGAPYKTFHKAYTEASSGDTIDATGTFNWADIDETGDSTITGYTLSKNLTITGHGPDQTIFQAGSSMSWSNDKRVFTVDTETSVTIIGVAIRYGYIQWDTYTSNSYGGAGIRNDGTLTLSDSEIYDNYVSSCNYCYGGTGYGGGLYNYNQATVTDTTFYDNTGIWGGGAIAQGKNASASMELTNITVYSNESDDDTRFNTNGAGMQFTTGEVTITNSTVYDNAGHKTGGIHIDGATVYMKNTIVAGNDGTGSDYNNIYVESGTLTSGGYNIIGDSTSFSDTTGDWTDTDGDNTFTLNTVGTTGSLNIDTQASLNDNSNKTKTYGLLSDSIAINNGSATAHNSITPPAVDQRGASRVSTLDIGSFEYNGTGLTINEPTVQASEVGFSDIDYKQMTVSWTNGNGIRRIVFMKQSSTGTASPAHNTAYSPDSVFGAGSQIGTSGWYAIYDGYGTSVTVTGLTESTDYIFQVFEYNGITDGTEDYLTDIATNNPKSQASHTPTTIYVDSSNTGSEDGSSNKPYNTFTEGFNASVGGDTIDVVGIFNWADADETVDELIKGVNIDKDLTIQGHGPDETIFQAGDTLTWANDKRVFTVASNASSTITDVGIRYGYIQWDSYGSYPYGGAGVRNDGILLLENSEIYDNFSGGCNYCYGGAGFGGGLFNYATSTVTNCSFYDNEAYWGGGAIAQNKNASSNMTITNISVYSNVMHDDTRFDTNGGGMQFETGTVTITNSTVYDNYGHRTGGVHIDGATVNLKNTIIAGNDGTGMDYNNLYVESGTFNDNGYNIIGDSTNFTATTGDWSDLDGDNIFTLYSIGTTGTLNFDSSAAINSNPYKTKTYALLAGSIAINNGSDIANDSISIPPTDQRTASRASTVDIGAFEYAGTFEVPIVESFFPVDNATNVTSTTDLIITFDEAVDAESGNIVIYKSADDTVFETIDVTSDNVAGSGTVTITINPTSDFVDSTGYYVKIDTTAFDDTDSNSYAGISDTSTWSFTTGDSTNPTANSYFPTSGSSAVTTTAPLIITFSEAVDTESGNIVIYNSADDTVFETIDVTSGNVTGSGSATIEIDPTSDLVSDTEYYIFIDGTAFDDVAGNSYTGISASSTWTFTIDDFTAPSVSTLTPVDDATGVSIDNNLTIEFDEVVDAETGNIIIYKASDDSEIESIDVTSGQVTGTGTDTIIVNPSSDLDYETEYYVIISTTAFDDANSNSYVGLTASTTWSFTTADTPTCATVAHASTYNAYPTCGVATCESGYTLTNGSCIAAGGGGVAAAPASAGSGFVDAIVPMSQSKNVGEVSSEGLNILTYMSSKAEFQPKVSRSGQSEKHTIHIDNLDMESKKIIITIYSEPKIVELEIGESREVDLDGDGLADIKVSFNDLLLNRIDMTVEQLGWSDDIIFTEGMLVKESNRSAVYLVENNTKRPIANEQTFLAHNFSWSDIVEFKDLSSLSTGTILQSKTAVDSSQYIFSRDLYLGSTGKDVKQLQIFLNNNGFVLTSEGPGSPGNETEMFGSLTRQAVIKFQQTNNITPAVGYFGPITRSVLNAK